MTTVRMAVERARTRESWPPPGDVHLTDLFQHFLTRPGGSVRQLLEQMNAAASTKLPWAFILCRFKGEPPDALLEDPIEADFRAWLTPGSGGLIEYWRDASLGAVDITGSRVFGWVDVDVRRSEAGGDPGSVPPGIGRGPLIEAAIRALKSATGDPGVLQPFYSVVSVYPYDWSRDGVDDTTNNSRQFHIDGSAWPRPPAPDAVNLTPPFDGDITAHEMGHGFGMEHDLGPIWNSNPVVIDDYWDPACIMSEKGSFLKAPWNVAFGPAICLPHLIQRGWMYANRVYTNEGRWAREGGVTVQLAPIDRPGVAAYLGAKLTNPRAEPAWDYYLEYVTPTAWNAGVQGAPYLFVRRISSPPGKPDRPTYLGGVHIDETRGSVGVFVEPSGRTTFRAELTDPRGPVITVTATPH